MNEIKSELSSKKKIGVLYLGIKGGGAVVTEALCAEMVSASYELTLLLNSQNEILSKYKKLTLTNIFELEIPTGLVNLINPFNLFKCVFKVWRCLKKNNVKSLLIPMHHPYSVILIPFLRLCGIKVISGIHDFIPHEGDRKLLIKLANYFIIIFSSTILFFSTNQLDAASKKLPIFSKKLRNIRLANDFQRSDSFLKPVKPSNDFIFFGRLEPYKGIKRLKEAWTVLIELDPKATILIRGNGPESEELKVLRNLPGVDCKIGYIDNSAIEKLMSEVKVIVAPYDSASQSGITGIAASFGMLAVTTPCEGFIEQAKYNSRIIVVDDFSPASFAISMLEARKAWDWNSIHEDLIISTGFVDKLFDV